MNLPVLARFRLYGFLKNQRYFEPFLILVLLEKGFDFLLIGLLVSFREISVHLLEIPSGAVADACGRRRSMVLSFVAYIVCFLLLGFAANTVLIFLAFLFFAIGEAFRTGTHKAMIFEWLRLRGRTHEKTRVYGDTRSWSKLGSAVSSLLAATFVILSDSYTYIFFFAVVPYALNIANFLGYPPELDGAHPKARSPGEVFRHLREALADVVRTRPLRRLVGESMGWEGVFHAVKDYLQPALQAAVLAGWSLAGSSLADSPGTLPADGWSETQRTALLVGLVYFALYLLCAAASRRAHRLVAVTGSEERAAKRLWAVQSALFLLLAWAAFREALPWVIAIFCAIHVLQNVWRPILISRFDAHSRESRGATVLSVESQAHRLGTVILAPLLGWAVDTVRLHGVGGPFWPIGVAGAGVALFFLLSRSPAGGKDHGAKPHLFL